MASYIFSRKIGKIWCQTWIFEFDYLGWWKFSHNVLYTIRCRIKWATKWRIDFFGNRLLTGSFNRYIEKWTDFCEVEKTVFLVFRFYIGVDERCHIYSFVEQVKLYRMVYDLVFNSNKFFEKNHKNWKLNFSLIF